MRFPFPFGKSGRRRRPATARRFHPFLECLETRCVPTQGIFIEDFGNDSDPSQPGWDSYDDDPLTFPGGDNDNDPDTHQGPDELHVLNDFPFPAATNGPTATGGYAV